MSIVSNTCLIASGIIYGIAKIIRWIHNINSKDQIANLPHLSAEQLSKINPNDQKYSEGVVITGRATSIDMKRMYFYDETTMIFQLTSLTSNTRCQVSCDFLKEKYLLGVRRGYVDRYSFLLRWFINDKNWILNYFLNRKFIFNDDMITVLGQLKRNNFTGENYIVAEKISLGNYHHLNNYHKNINRGLDQYEHFSKMLAVFGLLTKVVDICSYLFTKVNHKASLRESKSGICSRCKSRSINVALTRCLHFSMCEECFSENPKCNVCHVVSNSAYIAK